MRILVPWVSCAVAVISLIVLIVIGITQVEPYDQARHFKKTQCQVHTIVYNDSRSCDRSMTSLGSYNCILVTVRFENQDLTKHRDVGQHVDRNESYIFSTLYDTEKKLHEAQV